MNDEALIYALEKMHEEYSALYDLWRDSYHEGARDAIDRVLQLVNKPSVYKPEYCIECGQELMSAWTDKCYGCHQKREVKQD